MPYRPMLFRGTRVFVEVDEAGALVLDRGRARMKYRLEDDRLYNPVPANLAPASPDDPMPASAGSTVPAKPRAARSRPSARTSPVPSPPPADGKTIIAWSDGACLGNPGPAGLGYLVCFPDGRRVGRGEPLGQGTNNIGELEAISRVLDVVGATPARLVIHTDSAYAIGVLTAGWKPKANQELIRRIRGQLTRFPGVELRKVPGHAGVPDNELVDDLARRAAAEQRPVDL